MKKILSLVLAAIMVLSMGITAFAAENDVVILYTNDVHTYIDGALSYDVIAGYKTQLTAAGNDVILVDAGDHIQGTAYGSMDKGKTIIELMNSAGYDLATLGNHEFDYGMEGRINVTDVWASFPYVSCNFFHEADGIRGASVLDTYKVFTAGGKKIAFIGITTPESFTKSTPKYFMDEHGKYIYGIAGGEDGQELYDAVQAAIDAASAEADIVIALGHLGDDVSSQPWTSEELIANTTGLDAFIDGHSHSTVVGKNVADKNGDAVLLTQTGEYFDTIGKMTIKADGTVTTELVTEVTAEPDAATKAIKEAWMTDVDTLLGTKIGTAGEIVLDNYDAEGNRLVRKYETNTGDFAADALYHLFDVTEGLKVDAAIMNGGGVRNKAITGDISYKTCKEIHTFGNVACLITVTGQQLLDALEWGAKNTPASENGGFLHVSGVTYEVHGYIPSTVQADDKGVWVGGPTGEYRVKNVTVGGQPLELDKEYNLAGYNYTLRDLGDGFAMFDGAKAVKDYVMEDYMVLANYVQSFGGGVLPEKYAAPQGRITVYGEYTEALAEAAPATADRDWNPYVKQAIDDFIATYGGTENAYVVFDFDNTTSIFDVEEQLAVYQLQVMAFEFTPEEMPAILATELGDLNEDRTSLGYGNGSYQDWIDDITAAYTYLYNTYGPFDAAGLDEAAQATVQADAQWLEFATKMRAMYDLVYDAESPAVAYPWVLYWFTGMTEQEVYDLAKASHTYYGAVETSEVEWTTPGTDTKVGPVSYTWTSG
ncbi:MAG: bifunctional metallophosphatase/5'-nucleotidase, partial [Oscillospiraceae bacterium]|nr:bifunctional metallophosphatase/5'-nucleotidase [Oscillospiraceae bacterium]